MNSLFLRCALLLTASLATPPVAPTAPAASHCTYPDVRADTRELLLRIDQELPRAVAVTRAEMRHQGREKDLPDIWLDSCFRQLPLQHAYSNGEHVEAALRRQLTHYYYKPLDFHPDYPQWLDLQVLEYATNEAATAAGHLQDSLVTSLVARCRNRDHKLESCATIDSYRVSRHRNCLVRSSFYSQDPMRQAAMRWVLGNLPY